MKSHVTGFILLLVLGPSALAALLIAEAQLTGTVYRLGVLCPTQCEDRTHFLWKPVTQGLRDFGWIEGQNFVFEFRSAFGKAEELPRLASELVSAKPDVIMAPSPAAAQALKEATRTDPDRLRWHRRSGPERLRRQFCAPRGQHDGTHLDLWSGA